MQLTEWGYGVYMSRCTQHHANQSVLYSMKPVEFKSKVLSKTQVAYSRKMQTMVFDMSLVREQP